MTVELTTPALLFPAISLLFLSYTNRYLALGGRIRHLHSDLLNGSGVGGLEKQIANLKKRLALIRWMQVSGAASLCWSVLSMGLIFVELDLAGGITFFIALFSMMVSLLFLVVETSVSGGALKAMLEHASESKAVLE